MNLNKDGVGGQNHIMCYKIILSKVKEAYEKTKHGLFCLLLNTSKLREDHCVLFFPGKFK